MTLSPKVTIPALATVFAALALAGCGNSDAPHPPSGSKSTAAAAPPVQLPNPRPGLWKTTTVTADGARDEIEDCIAPGDSPLEAIGAPQVAGCDRNAVHAAPGGYDIDVRCSSDGVTMAVKGSVRGDFRTTMTMDIELGLGAEDGVVETTRFHSESRYAGVCPAA